MLTSMYTIYLMYTLCLHGLAISNVTQRAFVTFETA